MGGVGLVGSRGKGPSWPVSLSGWHPISGDTAGSSAVWALGLFQGCSVAVSPIFSPRLVQLLLNSWAHPWLCGE